MNFSHPAEIPDNGSQSVREGGSTSDVENVFRSLLEDIPNIAVQGYDQSRTVIFWNRASEILYGYSRGEALGRKLEDLIIPPHMREWVIGAVRNWVDNGVEIPAGELTLLKKDGALTPVYSSHVMLTNRDNEKEMYCIDVDLSVNRRMQEEKRWLQEQIQNTQKLESLGILAGGIAHDFNNLLMGVMGNADLALSMLPKDSPASELIKNIGTSARQAAELCVQMLAYSGKGKFVVEPLDLNELIREIWNLLKGSISRKATVSWNLGDGIPLISADASQVRQIIMNLLTNASDAIEERGIISISTAVRECNARSFAGTYIHEDLPDGRYVYIEISDTGCGMDRQTISRIFDPFFTTKFTGRGLGLASVLGIIRGHHGVIGVESQPGKGTTFRIYLPSLEEVVRRKREEIPETEWHGSGIVLLVDDEAVVLEVGRHMLERSGFTVITVRDGKSALEEFQRLHAEIACVILDLTMPGMSGEDTFGHMIEIDPNACILISSGYTEQEMSSRFIDVLPEGFIHKPYTSDQLSSKLRKLISSRRKV